jgi:hypothetical protein
MVTVLTALVFSGFSSPVSAAADTTPPPTPANFKLEQRTATSLRFNWSWTSDNGGWVQRYELSYAGKIVLIDHAYPGHSQNISDLNFQPNSAYSFELRAIDQAGNRSAIPARFVFETTPPGAASNLHVVSMSGGYPDIIGLTAAPDNGGIRDYEVFLNGESLGMIGRGANQFSLMEQIYYIACIDPPSGPATLQLRAVDSSFNASPALSAPLTVVFP